MEASSSTEIIIFDMAPYAELDLNDPQLLRKYWDDTHFVTTLQAIANRHSERLFVRYNPEPDDFWLGKASAEGAWLSGRPVRRLTNIFDLVEAFRSLCRGVVLYDERVAATSNVASSIAGIEDLLAIRYDESRESLYAKMVLSGPKLPVVRRLINEDGSPMFTGRGTIPDTDLPSSGSAKNDAYRWMMEKYIKTGMSNPFVIGYYIDAFWLQCWFSSDRQNHTLNNHDYVLSRRGVIVDLNVWEDEACIDDPDQKPGTDLETLKMVLRASYDQFEGDGIIHAPGFVPWAFKYTHCQTELWSAGGTHNEYKTEWRFTEVLTAFNAYKDADALSLSSFPNASFYQHYPLPDVVPQNPRPTREQLIEDGILDEDGRIIPRYYYANYQGDYDAAAWIYWLMPEFWTDEGRGKVPMTWALNPNLADRFPLAMHWIRSTATVNETFVTGDSGAGYVIPAMLCEPRHHSGLPSGIAAWEKHCRKYYKQWDIDTTGFIIDGETGGMPEEAWDAYARFSPGGIVVQKAEKIRGLHNGVPYIRINRDLQHELDKQVATMLSHLDEEKLKFIFHRSVLRPPSQYVELEKQIQQRAPGKFRLVDLHTLMYLIKEFLENREYYEKYSPYFDTRELCSTPEHIGGIRPAKANGNPIIADVKDDQPVWRIPAGTHLHFDVNDTFSDQGVHHAELVFEYFDEGKGDVQLHYDSSRPGSAVDGPYAVAEIPVPRCDSREWRRHKLVLDDMVFSNCQNYLTDLRLHNTGDDFLLGKIIIRRLD